MPEDSLNPPARLEALTQWQVGKVAIVGARLTAARMPLGGRAEFAVLASLDEAGPLSQADLGRRLGLDRNDVNAVARRLDQAGFIVRHPDPSDRRRNTVTITPQGSKQLDDLEAAAHEVQDELLDGLTDDERTQLRIILAKVLSRHGAQPS